MASAAFLLLLAALLPLCARADTVTWQKCKDKSYLSERALKSTPDLEATTLYLGYCDIDSLNYGDLDYIPNVKKILLYHNRLVNVVGTMFRRIPGLEELDLSDNRIVSVPQFGYYSLFQNLTKFSLQDNRITGICHLNTFSAMGKLEILNLENNQIAYIHPEMFKPLVSLKEIKLGGNNLEYISEKMFQIKTLETVYLNDNMIQYVAADAFLGSPVRLLWLQGNRLTYLPENFLLEVNRAGGKLDSFPLSGNQWQCACLLELIADANRIGAEYWSYSFAGGLPVCVTDSRVQCIRTKQDEVSVAVFILERYLSTTKARKSCFY